MLILKPNNRFAGGEFEVVRGVGAKKMDSCLRRNDNFLFPRQVVRRRSCEGGFSLMEGPGGRPIAAGGEFGAGRGAVRRRRCAGGFSLMEVLFAVVILTLGLVFVAANFPVGIMNASKVAESTRTIIDTHNAEVMTELQLGGLSTSVYFGHSPANKYINTDGTIHLLRMPNVLPYIPGVRPDEYVVMDDPCGIYFPTDEIIYNNPNNLPTYITIDSDGYLDRGNIGMVVSPAVDISDQEVQKRLPGGYTYDDEQAAIYDVSIERNYSWCALYRHITGNTYNLYIYTLRRHNKNARYAIQEPTAFTTSGEPIPGLQGYDRLFPVPWRIYLGDTFIDDREFIADSEKPPSYFSIDIITAKLLGKGSIIIDADTENPLTAWPDNGYVYEVIEIQGDEFNGFIVRLNRPLDDDLNNIWFFPPPIVRTGSGDDDYIFEGKQPVVKVTRKIMRF